MRPAYKSVKCEVWDTGKREACSPCAVRSVPTVLTDKYLHTLDDMDDGNYKLKSLMHFASHHDVVKND